MPPVRRARDDVDGGPRGVHVSAPPSDPFTIRQTHPADLGAAAVVGERFRAIVTPESPWTVVHWVGFTPPAAAHSADAARTERLRALGYVD